MPLIRLAWLKPNQAISEGAYFYLENNKEYKSRTGSRVCGPKKLLVTFGYKSNMKKSFSLCLLAKRTVLVYINKLSRGKPRSIKMMNLNYLTPSPVANTTRQPPVSPFIKGDHLPVTRRVATKQSFEDSFFD